MRRERVTEREPARRRHRVGEVQGLGVERVGGPERDRHAQRGVERRRVPAQRRAVDDVVVHQRAEVQQLDRGRAAAPRAWRSPCAGELEHEPGTMARTRRRDRAERTGDRFAERARPRAWSRRSTSASREASSATRRDDSRRPPWTSGLTEGARPRRLLGPMDVRIHDLLARLAAVSPHRVGATLGDDVRTFAQLDAGANRAAHRLIAEGVAPRDRVVWWGPTVLDALELGYGISKAGGTLAPINPNFSEAEALDALADAAAAPRGRAPRRRGRRALPWPDHSGCRWR